MNRNPLCYGMPVFFDLERVFLYPDLTLVAFVMVFLGEISITVAVTSVDESIFFKQFAHL